MTSYLIVFAKHCWNLRVLKAFINFCIAWNSIFFFNCYQNIYMLHLVYLKEKQHYESILGM